MPSTRPSLSAAALLTLLLPALAGSRDWQGIDPGKSSCADVVTRFGEPPLRKPRGSGSVLVYKDDQAMPGTKVAQFTCRADGVVELIEFYVATVLDAESIEGNYGKPEAKTFDTAFNKVWQYPSQGVAVYFDKDGVVKAILLSAPTKGSKAPKAAPPPAGEKPDAKAEKAP